MQFARRAVPFPDRLLPGLLGPAALAALGLTAPAAHAQNLVQDGGFELAAPGGIDGMTTAYNAAQSFDGGFWTVTQGTAGIDTIDQYVFAGSKSLFLTDGTGPDAVTQTLATVPGRQYAISFYANADTANSLTVLFGGVPVAGAPTTVAPGTTPWPGNWTYYTASATAASSETALTLRGISQLPGQSLSNVTVELDDVSVTPVAAPEPSQTAALGLGVLGVAGLILKARRRPANAV